LSDERPDDECARSPRLALCFHEKAMAAARNRERSGGEARSGRFGLTIPQQAILRHSAALIGVLDAMEDAGLKRFDEISELDPDAVSRLRADPRWELLQVRSGSS